MLKKCQVFTPEDISIKMLKIAGYENDLYGKKILENSCGDGQILIHIVRKYIEDGLKKRLPINKIKKGLQNDIYGIEIDTVQAGKCKENLNDVCKEYKIKNVVWNIFIEDALKIAFSFQFDFIIGNPPYINYREMEINDRKYLRETFKSCGSGKFDYCYAFIEKSINLLSDNGKLIYLIPNCIFKNVFAQELRDMIKPMLTDIYDYTSRPLFDAKLTSSAIICMQKGASSHACIYHDIVSGKNTSLQKDKLIDKWIFDKAKTRGAMAKFSDYFIARCSVATLYNDAFLLEPINSDEKFYYLDSNSEVEKTIVREAASPRSKAYNQCKYIVFPYEYSADNQLVKISEERLKTEFPKAYSYLLEKKDDLIKTNKDSSAMWFEYGRSQALRYIRPPRKLNPSLKINDTADKVCT